MHRYHSLAGSLLAVTLVLAGCALPTARENVDAAADLVRTRTRANLEWRRDPAADLAARKRAEELLASELTPEAAVGVAFLVHPSLQLALEKLAISRSALVKAMTPPNPVGIIGSRKPGGDLAVFYPERAISIGVMINVIGLLTIPDNAAIARLDLQRVRYEQSQEVAEHAALVVQSWLEYSAALRYWQQFEGAPEKSREAIDAEMDAATKRARLGGLMGVAGWHDDWKLSVSLPAAPATDPDPSIVEATAMKQRLDLLAAAQQVDVRLRTLGMQRRFRWVNQLDVGMFRDKALGGTPFVGPNAGLGIPVFDQRIAEILEADASLHAAVRTLEAAQINARTEIRVSQAAFKATRQHLDLFTGDAASFEDPAYVSALLDYWRARSALAFTAGDWAAISGL
jgi:multidrug efflux system outer membrane protein